MNLIKTALALLTRKKSKSLKGASPRTAGVEHSNQAEVLMAPESKDNYIPPFGLLAWANPLNLCVKKELDAVPTLNVLVPGLGMQNMSGGPNTLLNLAYRMAGSGIAVRFIATGAPPDANRDALWDHLGKLAGIQDRLKNVSIVDGCDRSVGVEIGSNDVFMVSAWWNAQMVKFALHLTKAKKFIYLIQDIETCLHDHSTEWAMANETYSFDFVPIINHKFLFSHMKENAVGRFSDEDFCRTAIILDAAIDRKRFFPEPRSAGEKRKLLFYARPGIARRNLFEIGLAALQYAAQMGAFNTCDWEVFAMGESIPAVKIDEGLTLQPAPWLSFDGYADQMRSADILLSLMLSPHPSYPPLEMAACGGLVVTNSFGEKTQEAFQGISSNILAPEPRITDIALAICEAIRRLEQPEVFEDIDAPESWDVAFSDILPYAIDAFGTCRSE